MQGFVNDIDDYDNEVINEYADLNNDDLVNVNLPVINENINVESHNNNITEVSKLSLVL